MSGIELKSPPIFGYSMVGDMTAGELTIGKGVLMSGFEGAPLELLESLTMSSIRVTGPGVKGSVLKSVIMGGWAMPAFPNPSKMSTLQALSGIRCKIGLTRRGRISWTLFRSRGTK